MIPSKARRLNNIFLALILLIGSVSILAPLYMTIVTALKDRSEMTGNLWSLPSEWKWSNFSDAVNMTNYWSAFGNSALITVSVVVLVILTNSMVGYAIARNMHRKPFKFMYFYFLSAMFIPFPIIMLPLVKQMAAMGISNRWGLILLYTVFQLSFNTLLYTGYMQSIPVALEEAAFIDGANVWQTYWKVVFPLLTPINATVAILTGLYVWNDFLLPLVILSDASEYTLPLAQYVFQSQFTTNYNLAFSSYLLAMAPMMVVYLFLQRWIIGGVSQGAVKA